MGKNFPILIRKYMETAGIEGPAELARQIGVDNSYGTRLLNGDRQKVGPELAQRIATTLSVPEASQMEFFLQAAGYSDERVEQLLLNVRAQKISPISSDETVVLEKKCGRWHLKNRPKHNV